MKGKAWLRNLSIKYKIAIAMIMIATVPISTFGIIANIKIAGIIDNLAESNSETVLDHTINNIEYLMNDVSKLGVQLGNYQEIKQYNDMTFSNMDRILQIKKIEQYLSLILGSNPYISSMYICFANGTIVTVSNLSEYEISHYKNFNVYKQALEPESRTLWSGFHENEFRDSKHKTVMTFSLPIYSLDNSTASGVIILNIPMPVINNISVAGLMNKEDNLSIIDLNGNFMYTMDKQTPENLESSYVHTILDKGVLHGNFIHSNEGRNEFISYKYSNVTKWIYVTKVDLSEMYKQSHIVKRFSIWAILFCILLSVILSMLLASNLTKPVQKLVKSLRRVEKGDFTSEIAVVSHDEIGRLTATYNKMLGELRSLMERIKSESRLKRQSDLNILQAQITPHFIYNFLTTIRSISRSQEDERIYKLTSGLIGLLQTSISKQVTFVTIEEELQLVQSYVYLQQIRYNNQFEVVYEIDETLKPFRVLKMLLQPLVENALFHGMDLVKGDGLLRISIRSDNHTIIFSIADNGKGMTEEQMRKLFADGNQGVEKKYRGIGIKNIRDRIKLYFGERFGLQVESKKDEGTLITITMPLIKDESECEQYV
ncbi:sensor histidine kinase [Paenibacillus eucommiae]|uniref:histidine kinase n=1 Tax=Paenibacillus eucommiae TaxID=1355755 RepID=A0ABS4J1Q4_9BACL|nr:sensor histidine kinase [Paenibacillus eucommiae]MBP1993718.1 two-component system sensor histidine kinase YesM [Paenibacillus eucommiae]